MSSLSDRLKAMGGQPTPRPVPPQPATQTHPIENVITGEEMETMYGRAFLASELFPSGYRHGLVSLEDVPDRHLLAEWSGASHLDAIGLNEIVFLDTETSGLSGGTGTYAFLIGLGYHTAEGFRVDQLFLRSPAEETAFLTALDERLTAFKAIVSFNGKAFDLPIVNTRCTLNGLSSPVAGKEHVDLLHLARRLWRARLASRALGDLERDIFGIQREAEEVPGYLIPQYYFDYLTTADARPLKGVFYHNVIDIATLAALFNHTARLLADPSQGDVHSLDLAAIARIYEELGRLEQAAEMYNRCIDLGLPEEHFFKTVERYAAMRRRQGQIDLAAQLWSQAAERGYLPAQVEMAKYYEHACGNPREARRWALTALELAAGQAMPLYQRRFWLNELTHRLERLERKCARVEQNPTESESGGMDE